MLHYADSVPVRQGHRLDSGSSLATIVAGFGRSFGQGLCRVGRRVLDAMVESGQRRAERYVRDYHRYF